MFFWCVVVVVFGVCFCFFLFFGVVFFLGGCLVVFLCSYGFFGCFFLLLFF